MLCYVCILLTTPVNYSQTTSSTDTNGTFQYHVFKLSYLQISPHGGMTNYHNWDRHNY